jgi:hypothetical protein
MDGFFLLIEAFVVEVLCPLGDVDGAVGDAFQVVVDLENGAKKPDVATDRLIECHKPDSFRLDLDLFIVDISVALDCPAGETFIGVECGFACLLEDVLDEAGHAQRSAL